MNMARRKAKVEEAVQEIPTKDFGQAVNIYRQDIRPAVSKQQEHAQEASTGYKAIKKNCHVQPQAAKQAFRLWFNTEDAKRDDFLRSFCGCINEAAGREVVTFNESDLFASERPRLVAIDGDSFEAGEDELALQRDRPSVEAAQAAADAASEGVGG